VSAAASATSRRRRPDPAAIVLAVAVAVSAIILLDWLGDLTFWRDEWGFLLHRRGSDPGVYLEPHYEHIAISLIALYKGLLAAFGMDSALPWQVVSVASLLGSLVLVFVYARRCVGGWLALAGVLPILLFGPAWDDVLWPFQIGFFGSMCAGVGALLLLERRDRAGDIAACVLLVVSITFSSLGVPFAVGGAVAIALDPARRQRAWVAVVPIALYGLWWLGYGHDADNYTSLHNLVTAPGYILDGFAASTASLFGLATPSDTVTSPLDWGRGLFVLLVVLAALRIRTAGWPGRGFWIVLAIAVTFWFAAAFNASVFREPSSGRYQYMGAIFIVLLAAELFRGARPGRWTAAVAVGIAAIAALSNTSSLHSSWQGLTQFGEKQPAGLAALELTRDTVAPDFQLTEQNSEVDYLGFLDAESYFSAVDEFGSPAYTPAELASASEPAREAADEVFAAALDVGLSGHVFIAGRPHCTPTALDSEPRPFPLDMGAVGIEAAPGHPVEVRLRRYATERFPVKVGTVRGGITAPLAIPPDGSDQPWQLGLSGSGTAQVCEGGP
jgi:hypothetical protein